MHTYRSWIHAYYTHTYILAYIPTYPPTYLPTSLHTNVHIATSLPFVKARPQTLYDKIWADHLVHEVLCSTGQPVKPWELRDLLEITL